jgi:hypothetical protein
MPREEFFGTWALASIENRFADGRIEYPYGQHPVGQLTYGPAREVSVQIMRPDRPASIRAPSDVASATRDDLIGVLAGYFAYGGSFEVDDRRGSITHHVKVSLWPGQVGADVVRSFTLAGETLTLRSPTVGSGKDERVTVFSWRR